MAKVCILLLAMAAHQAASSDPHAAVTHAATTKAPAAGHGSASAAASAAHGSASAAASAAHGSKAASHGSKAAGHGHGHGHSEEGDVASGVVLIGVVFIMAIFYLVNSHHQGVPRLTWQAISSAVSIFVAVMAYNGFTSLSAWILIKKNVHDFEHDVDLKVYLGAAMMVFWFAIVELCLFVMRTSKLRLAAYGTVGGHVLGFAAIDLYGAINELPAFAGSFWMTFVVCLIYIVTFPIILTPVVLLFKFLGKKGTKENMDRCHEQAKETSIDAFCMGLSKLMSMFLLGLLNMTTSGHGADEAADSTGHHGYESLILFCIGVAVLIMAGGLSALRGPPEVNGKKAEGAKYEILNLATVTFSLTAAWVFIDVGSWHFMHRVSSHFLGASCVAMVNTFVFVVAIYALSTFLEKGGTGHDMLKMSMKGEFFAISLMVGLSWEHVFDAAVEGVGKFGTNPAQEKLLTSFSVFVFLLIVFPAWVVHMLTKHDPELKSEYASQNLAPYHAFCDWGSSPSEYGQACDDDYEDEEADEE